jgi:hypothetical protein
MLLFSGGRTGHKAKKYFAIRPNRYFPRTYFSVVILRSPANSETTKNLEILRAAQDDNAFLREACLGFAEGLRITVGAFSVLADNI